MRGSTEVNAYEELGNYVVAFQGLNYSIHALIIELATKNGLKEKNVIDNLGESDNTLLSILLSEKSIYDLLHNLKAFITALYNEESEEYEIISEISKFLLNKKKVLARRNDILHAFLHVDETNYPFDLHIYRKKSKGKKGFGGISKFESDLISNQIKYIIDIKFIIHLICENLQKNSKFTGEVCVGTRTYTISCDKVKEIISRH